VPAAIVNPAHRKAPRITAVRVTLLCSPEAPGGAGDSGAAEPQFNPR
jgi:hypothetical protein